MHVSHAKISVKHCNSNEKRTENAVSSNVMRGRQRKLRLMNSAVVLERQLGVIGGYKVCAVYKR